MPIKFNFLNPKRFGLSVNQCVGIALLIMSALLLYNVLGGQSLWFTFFAVITAGFFILYYPEAGLIVAFVSTMWFERWFTLQSFTISGTEYKLYPLDILLGFIGISLLWQAYLKQLKWHWKKLDTAILAFGAVCLLAYARSWFKAIDPALAFGTFKNYILYAIVYVFATLILENERQWERFMNWFLLGGIGLFFFVVYGLIARHGLWIDFTPLSTSGTRLIAGTHAFYLALFAFWLLALYLWPPPSLTAMEGQAPPSLTAPSFAKAPEGKPEGRVRFVLSQQVVIFCLTITAFGILFSLVRHLWLALGALVILWIIVLPAQSRRQIYKLAKGALAAAAAIGILYVWISYLFIGSLPNAFNQTSFVLKQRLLTTVVYSEADSSARWRLAAWQAGLRLWQANPVFGTGLGQLINGYDGLYNFEVAPRELHNDYLGILVQLGLLGGAVLIYWFYHILKLITAGWKKVCDQDSFKTRLVFTWGSAAILLIMVFSIAVYWDANFYVIWWWLSLAAVRWAAAEGKT